MIPTSTIVLLQKQCEHVTSICCHESVIDIEATGRDFTTCEVHGYVTYQRAQPHLPQQLSSHDSTVGLNLVRTGYRYSRSNSYERKGFRMHMEQTVHRGKGIIGFASEKKITHTAVHARHAPRASYLVVVSS